jgi:hypothetical protein
MLTEFCFNTARDSSRITSDLVQRADGAFRQNDRVKCLRAIERLYKTADYKTK